MNKAYFETSCLSPAFTDSLQLRDVFSNLSLYKNEMGTKLPFLLHSQPWAALKAAPRDAESVRGKKKKMIQRLIHQAQLKITKGD